MREARLNPALMSRRSAIILISGLMAAVIFLVDGFVDLGLLARIAKPIPVLCMALWLSLLPDKGRFQWAVIVGLLLSAAGDIFLGGSTFLIGLVSFLLAHIAYTTAFIQDCRRPAIFLAILAYSYGALMFTFLLIEGQLGDMTIPVLFYVLVICTMLWRAAARMGAPGVAMMTGLAGLLGAAFFTISDSLLSINMFVQPLPLERLLVMLTYWAGQIGFSLAAAWQEETE